LIARLASHPLAGNVNVNVDPTSLPAYRLLDLHLLRTE
jgi:hypothetical protein